jgi:hypothetical protein
MDDGLEIRRTGSVSSRSPWLFKRVDICGFLFNVIKLTLKADGRMLSGGLVTVSLSAGEEKAAVPDQEEHDQEDHVDGTDAVVERQTSSLCHFGLESRAKVFKVASSGQSSSLNVLCLSSSHHCP